MTIYAEKDYRGYGEDQGFRWDEGFSLDALVYFEHEGMIIVNPYSHTERDPTEFFGKDKIMKTFIRLSQGREFARGFPVELATINQQTADDHTMSTEELGGGMDDDVGTLGKRSAQVRRGKGRIYHQR